MVIQEAVTSTVGTIWVPCPPLFILFVDEKEYIVPIVFKMLCLEMQNSVIVLRTFVVKEQLLLIVAYIAFCNHHYIHSAVHYLFFHLPPDVMRVLTMAFRWRQGCTPFLFKLFPTLLAFVATNRWHLATRTCFQQSSYKNDKNNKQKFCGKLCILTGIQHGNDVCIKCHI